jgi:hypothetical protein
MVFGFAPGGGAVKVGDMVRLNVAACDLFDSHDNLTPKVTGKMKHGELAFVVELDPKFDLMNITGSTLEVVCVLTASGTLGWSWTKRFNVIEGDS